MGCCGSASASKTSPISAKTCASRSVDARTAADPIGAITARMNLREQEAILRLGGGDAAIRRQHEKGRLTARERIARLIDPGSDFLELGLWAAWNMYAEWGRAPSAGVVTGI